MLPESENNLRLEIGHVLFIALVGYSKLLVEEQKERLRKLTDVVLATTQVSKIADLKVISRTSTQHYKSAPENLPEIARQLDVAHFV